MSGNQEMEKKFLKEKDVKNAMIQARNTLPDLDIYCYDSIGKPQGTKKFRNYHADVAKKTKLFEEVKIRLKDCKEETKFYAYLGKKPGKGKKLKFGENGLTGKSSILKLYCAAFGGAFKLGKLIDKQAKDIEDITHDYFADDIEYDTYNDRITKAQALIEKVTICIQIVE